MSFIDKFLSILSIVSGPPEKKMGIKASNTAEVRLFTDFYNTGRYCIHVLVEGIIILTQFISHFFKVFSFICFSYLTFVDFKLTLLNLLTPKIQLLILPSGSYTFPCKFVARTWC